MRSVDHEDSSIVLWHAACGRDRSAHARCLSEVWSCLLYTSPGAVACLVFRNQENPAKFLIIEEWASPEAQRAAQLATPPDQLRHLRILLAGSEAATFYDPLP